MVHRETLTVSIFGLCILSLFTMSITASPVPIVGPDVVLVQVVEPLLAINLSYFEVTMTVIILHSFLHAGMTLDLIVSSYLL